MTHEQALQQWLEHLRDLIAAGLAASAPLWRIAEGVLRAAPNLERLQGEAWLEAQARTLKPRRAQINEGGMEPGGSWRP